MSLSDHLRYLRAMKGGSHISDVAQAAGVEKVVDVNMAEKQYRPLADEGLMEKLAVYYGRPLDEFHWHNARSRKKFTYFINQAKEQETAISLVLRHGETLTGTVTDWDLACVALRLADGRVLVVQRHAVIDWSE
ncbi:MAG TPA: hypothetical protein PLD25_13425 [Chloroflexota bacterium]|nr:hypothetical protein [Chloroflexota bacterium]